MTPEQLASVGLRYAETGPVATITLDRPEVRNAQTPAMWHALGDLGAQIPDSVRVVVVTGEGSTFSAGLDKAMLDPRGGRGDETVAGCWPGATRRSRRRSTATSGGSPGCATRGSSPSPRCSGYAIGAGFQLALACDLRVVADDVQFCMKEPALGLVPDLTGTKPLVEVVGYSRALEICATARYVGARGGRAHRARHGVGPAAELDAAVADLVGAARRQRCRGRAGDQGAAAGSGRAGPGRRSGWRSGRPRYAGSASLSGLRAGLSTACGSRGGGDDDVHAVGMGPACRHMRGRPLRGRAAARRATPCGGSSGSPVRTGALIAGFLVLDGHRRRARGRHPTAGQAPARRRHLAGRRRSRHLARAAMAVVAVLGALLGVARLPLLPHRRGPDLRPPHGVFGHVQRSRWPSSPAPRPERWSRASTTT